MKKRLMILLLVSVVVALLTITASAASVSDLTYEIKDGAVIITDCDKNASGDLLIPDTIDGYPVTSIGDRAFFNCNKLTRVIMPDSVTTVGGGAFAGCTELRSVTLSSKLKRLGTEMIYIAPVGDRGDEEIDYDEIYFDVQDTYYVHYLGFFDSCSSLTTVKIPEGVTGIELYAFRGCSALESVDIPKHVNRIGKHAFDGCSCLEHIEIPSGVSIIRSNTFCDCVSLAQVTLLEGVKTIESYAFSGCSQLADLRIPSSVNCIKEYAFDETAIYDDPVHWTYGLLYIDNALIKAQPSVTTASVAEGTRLIADGAFKDCSSLTHVNLPTSLSTIGSLAFEKCSSLPSVRIPDGVSTTGGGLFYGCSNLGSAILPKHLDEIPSFEIPKAGLAPEGIVPEITDFKGFFEGCSNLTSVALPAGVTAIEENAFLNCTALTCLTIPDSLKSIKYNAFVNCSSLTDVFFTGSREQWDAVWIYDDDSPIKNATIHYNYVPFAITTQPVAVSTSAGKTAVFKVAATGSELNYQWQYKAPNGRWTNSPADGNRTATLKVPATVSRDGYQYRCMVKCGDETRYSKAAKLTVFGIKTQPTSVSSKVDKAVNFRVVATGPNLTYQWQYRVPNGEWKNSPATGNQTATLSVPVTMSRNGYQYRCVVKSGNNTVNSKAATLTVFGIKTQPKNVSTTAGKNVTMKVAATGKNLTYQWQYKTPSGDWKNSVGEGNQTNTLTIKATTGRHNYQFRCIVKSGSEKITSATAKLTVFGIKTQPKNITTTIGKTATFKVVATGSNLTYQWQYKAPGGSWKNSTMDSAKSATLKIPATAGRNNYQFRCIVKSGSSKITTNVVKLTAFGIKTQPTNVTAKVGSTATFKVVAVGSNLTYQWQYKAPGGSWKNSVGTGNQTAALKVPATNGRNGYQFRCIVKSGSLSVTSSVVKITVKK